MGISGRERDEGEKRGREEKEGEDKRKGDMRTDITNLRNCEVQYLLT